EEGIFPSLHHRKEGWLRHQELSRSHQSRRRRGGFPAVGRKTTPSSLSKDASQHFIDRSATPPCGAARRGIRPVHRFVLTMANHSDRDSDLISQSETGASCRWLVPTREPTRVWRRYAQTGC